jgi:putative ABC transport system permease protein
MGALLMVRSFQKLQRVDPGYDAERVLSVTFGSDYDERYADITRERSFFLRLEERLQRAAGVEAVSTEGFVRAFRADTDTAWGPGQIVSLEGGSPVQMSQLESSVVEPAFPRVLGLSVLEGRFLDDSDREGGERVTVLSRSLAQRISPIASVVGRTITIARSQYLEVGAPTKLARVVGVIEDRMSVRFSRDGLRAEPRTELYFSDAQAVGGNRKLLVRSAAATSLRRVVEEHVRAVDPDQTIARAETLAQQFGSGAMSVRIFAAMFGVVAGCALLLALIGMYGVVSYMAEQRRAEIGLRMALGATRRDIARQVVGYGLTLAVAGVGIGLVLGFGIGRLTRIMLFGVSVLDPLTCALVAIVFSAVAALSAYGPARRAMRVDPLTALRAQ